MDEGRAVISEETESQAISIIWDSWLPLQEMVILRYLKYVSVLLIGIFKHTQIQYTVIVLPQNN